MKHRLLPELIKGIRILYIDKDMKTRVEIIYSRTGNIITATNALKEKTRIEVGSVIGYWPPKVRTLPKNLIRLKK